MIAAHPHAQAGTIYLVGAGPGDPELLTLKAVRLLATADVVLHDDLVPPAVLLYAEHALVINVGKRCGRKTISQPQINVSTGRLRPPRSLRGATQIRRPSRFRAGWRRNGRTAFRRDSI